MKLQNVRLLVASVAMLVQVGCARSALVRDPNRVSPAPTGLGPVLNPDSASELGPARHATAASRAIVPRDLLDITVFDAPELSRVVRVADDGWITLPLLGPVRAGGRTPSELRAAVQDTLRRSYMHDPRVTVELKEPAAEPVYVVGEVNQPGAFVPSAERLTVVRAIAVARGVKASAAPNRAIVIRPQQHGERIQIPVNLNDAMRGKIPDLVLMPNDVVYVPKNAERVVALGLVDALVRVMTFRTVF